MGNRLVRFTLEGRSKYIPAEGVVRITTEDDGKTSIIDYDVENEVFEAVDGDADAAFKVLFGKPEPVISMTEAGRLLYELLEQTKSMGHPYQEASRNTLLEVARRLGVRP